MIPREVEAEVLARVGGSLLEGPAWDVEAGRVLFVDILGRCLHVIDWPSGRVSTAEVAETTTAWIPWEGGGSALVTRTGLRRVLGDVTRDPGDLVVEIEADLTRNRSNDAKCDLLGRLWIGTMADDATHGAGSLYRVDRDLRCTRVLHSLTISNGIGWRADGRRMFFIDSPTRRVDLFDYEPGSGRIRSRRPWVDTSGFAGVPDGLTMDAEDAVWVAMYDGGAVLRFDRDGHHVATVRVPVARPTSCAFAGPGLDRLVITTAMAEDGTGGDVYVCEPGITGTPTVAFAGAHAGRAT